jgi:Zn-dependent M28 family amino/carboxypeptidase
VDPASKGIKSSGKLLQADSTQFVNHQSRIMVQLVNKLTWSVANEVADYSVIQIDKKALGAMPTEFKAEIDNSFVSSFKAYNVAGVVKGTKKPDSMIIITAHYDHLGGMGKETYFPGANDNASGIALLLNLARYYAANPQPYSIGFILFAGEEAGLIGSKHFTENPLVPLRNIRFLLNTDLAGTGEEGITVVNATEFPQEFALMQQINKEGNYLTAVNARGKAANSDHYFFTEKGVPAFFFYTLGGIKAYHDVFDKADTLPLNEHEDLFKLVTGFCSRLMK